MNKVEDRELRRNGEGYLDLTAYHAIKKADADLEQKRNPEKKKKTQVRYRSGPDEKQRKMSLKQYIKYKINILNDLCVEMTEEEEQHLRSLTNEVDIDQFAHRLIMRGE